MKPDHVTICPIGSATVISMRLQDMSTTPAATLRQWNPMRKRSPSLGVAATTSSAGESGSTRFESPGTKGK